MHGGEQTISLLKINGKRERKGTKPSSMTLAGENVMKQGCILAVWLLNIRNLKFCIC